MSDDNTQADAPRKGLGGSYTSNAKASTVRKWLNVGNEGGQLLCSYWSPGSTEVMKLRTKYTTPYRSQIRRNALPDEVDRKIAIQVFVAACVHGARNIYDDTNDDGNVVEVTYSQDALVKLFAKYGDMYVDVVQDCSERGLFFPAGDTGATTAEETEVAAKN